MGEMVKVELELELETDRQRYKISLDEKVTRDK